MKALFLKRHPKAKQPFRKYKGDAGYDLFSIEDFVVPARGKTEISTGIAVALPIGHYAEIHSRSGLRINGKFPPVGIIDEGYRGDMRVILYNFTDEDYKGKVGDRVAQLIIKQRVEVEFKETDCLPGSDRGNDGFGSTGK